MCLTPQIKLSYLFTSTYSTPCFAKVDALCCQVFKGACLGVRIYLIFMSSLKYIYKYMLPETLTVLESCQEGAASMFQHSTCASDSWIAMPATRIELEAVRMKPFPLYLSPRSWTSQKYVLFQSLPQFSEKIHFKVFIYSFIHIYIPHFLPQTRSPWYNKGRKHIINTYKIQIRTIKCPILKRLKRSVKTSTCHIKSNELNFSKVSQCFAFGFTISLK